MSNDQYIISVVRKRLVLSRQKRKEINSARYCKKTCMKLPYQGRVGYNVSPVLENSGLSGTCPSSNQIDPYRRLVSTRIDIRHFPVFEPRYVRWSLNESVSLHTNECHMQGRKTCSYIHVYVCSDGEWFYEKNEINWICTPSSRNYRFFVRARRWKIWVTHANTSLAWKFVSGMFVGIVAVAPRAWKREESRFRGLSVDALSNTRLTLWVTHGRNAARIGVHRYIYTYIYTYIYLMWI